MLSEHQNRIAPEFAKALQKHGYDLGILEKDPQVVYGLDSDVCLSYFNPAWLTFLHENSQEDCSDFSCELGAHLGDHITGPLKDYYLDHYNAVLMGNQVWEHDYECSSANIFRRFHQRVYPLEKQAGLLLVNTLVKAQPHDIMERIPAAPMSEYYLDQHGLIHQCGHCRRTRRNDMPDIWDWVEQWVHHAPHNTSHGLCGPCMEYYYPDIQALSGSLP